MEFNTFSLIHLIFSIAWFALLIIFMVRQYKINASKPVKTVLAVLYDNQGRRTQQSKDAAIFSMIALVLIALILFSMYIMYIHHNLPIVSQTVSI